MLTAEASIVVRRSPEEVLAWIRDLERYRQADTKIARVLRQEDDRVLYRGRIRGVPTPADANLVELDPGRSLTFVGAPRWTRRVLDFRGSFRCEPCAEGTRLTHCEELGFKPWPVRKLAEWWLRDWLAADVEAEMARLAVLIEADDQ